MVEWGRLLSGCWGKTQPGVRIPPSPQKKTSEKAVFFYNLNGEGDSNPFTDRIRLYQV